jgi:NADH:ubiquinone oxidoreductase subunit 3 (subunit A)
MNNLNITLLVFILFIPVLALILLGLNTLLAPHNSNEDKLSTYECGVPVISGQTRESFPIHFYLVAMLFLIFDIELLLLLPLSVSLHAVGLFGFIIAIIFFIILTIGFIVEIATGAITIIQNNNKKDNTTSLTPSQHSYGSSISFFPYPSLRGCLYRGMDGGQKNNNNPNRNIEVVLKPISTNKSILSNLHIINTRFMIFDTTHCFSIFTNIYRIIVLIIIPMITGLLLLYYFLNLFKYTGIFNEEEIINILDTMAKTHMP